MEDNIVDIISKSSFTLLDGIFVYAKVASIPEGNHFMISQDSEEITVVTIQEKLTQLDLIERNKDDYRLISLNVSIPFYAVGFLAKVSDAIAKEGMNILIVSTYSKDYILVKADKIDSAIIALKNLGFKQS
jgi:hypothetical protein